jgi:hypothetical protein
MANASESTENIDRVLIARSETMAIDAADVRDARVAGADNVKAAQALNTDAHNGSAGGDQLESIQLIALDDSGEQKVVAERPKVHRQEPRITTEELRAKEKAGDIWAKSLVEDLDNAEKLPQPYRDGQIAEVLKKAQIMYRPEQRGHAEQPTEDQMDTGTMLAAEATKNPAAEPVKLFKEWVEKQAEGQQKEAFRQEVRQEAASLSPEMKARMEYLAEMRRKIDAAGLDEGGVNQAITQEQAKLKLRGRVEQNTQESWLEAGRRIAELPVEQQVEVIGAGLMAGHEQYRADERERAWGQIIGTTEGLGAVAVNLATIAEFTCDVVAGNKARAEERGGNFGKALGETLVSGVQLFNAADQYLFNVGCTGEYGKPFKDLAAFGGALNERWSQIPPREQEHIKYKLITEMAADGLIGAGGAKALAKAKTFTEVMDAVAVEAKAAGSGTVNAVNGVGRQVATDLKGMSEDVAAAGQHVIGCVDNVVWDLTEPEMALEGGGKIKFPRDLGRPADKPITHVLMSKADDLSGGTSEKPKDVRSGKREKPHEVTDEVLDNPEGLAKLAKKFGINIPPKDNYVFVGEKDAVSVDAAAKRLGITSEQLKSMDDAALTAQKLERVPDYRDAFFNAHPGLIPLADRIYVHHAIPKWVLKEYPGVFTASEINDVQSLRGVYRGMMNCTIRFFTTLGRLFYETIQTRAEQMY